MEIFHDGTHSHIIEKGGGNLALHTNSGGEIQLAKNDSGQYENMLRAVPDGAVILAYDNSTKLETTSTGVTVTGDLFFDNPLFDQLVHADEHLQTHSSQLESFQK